VGCKNPAPLVRPSHGNGAMERTLALAGCEAPRNDARERIRSTALHLLDRHGGPGREPEWPEPVGPRDEADAALATALMDAFRRTGDREVFDCLVRWVAPQLLARVRSRMRGLHGGFDATEILQDAIVNIYRYPDRFQANRPGAFAAWSTTIVDNAVRRQLRRARPALALTLRDPEVLQTQVDSDVRRPSDVAAGREEVEHTLLAYGILLQAYLVAFRQLKTRERYVLEAVEVEGRRYAEVAHELGIRHEALKMVVFRARKRIHDRLQLMLASD
jgi:RNA polymerase sigma factor (sigma-70 family)